MRELYSHYIRKTLRENCGIVCEPINPAMAIINRLLDDSISYFSYTLVLEGIAKVDINGSIITLNPQDLMITIPGAKVYTLEVSDDFSALCLMIDETTIYGTENARYAVRSAYSLSIFQSKNKISLNDDEHHALKKWMLEIVNYETSRNTFANDIINSLYSLFVYELMNIENLNYHDEFKYNHTSEIFLEFLKLLPANSVKHHDLQFYAEKLSVTPIYLSRIVKRHSGQTVKEHIDRWLLSEASVLLKRTDMLVANIAETLNFATPQSFCKFFSKNKGVSPREYQHTQLKNKITKA